jgi:hypothetical protein
MKKLLLGLTASCLSIAPAHAVVLYGVDELNNLVSFDSANPGAILSNVALSGVSGSSILAIDTRVLTDITYALTDDYRLFTVNRNTGATGLVSNLALTGSNFAMDFNPTNNNLRIVSNNDTNYVYNFVTNTLVPGTNVSYPGGVPNPDIVGAAYTNNDTNPATGTTLYVIDSSNNRLATLNVATGALTSVGSLGFNVGARTSFDIATVGNKNLGYVINGTTLYSVNLGTGALSKLGNTDRAIFGLTVGSVPEPTTWAMMLIGFGVIGGAMRRRTVKQQLV